MAVDPPRNRILAHTKSGDEDRVTVINGNTNAEVGHYTISSTGDYEDVASAVDSIASRIYIAFSGTQALQILDGATLGLIKSLNMGGDTEDVAVNPATRRVYVVAESDLVFVDGASNTILKTISDLGSISKVAVDSARNRVYVAGGSKLHVLDHSWGATLTTVSGLPYIRHLDVDPALDKVYLAHESADCVSALSNLVQPAATPTATATRPYSPWRGYLPRILALAE